MAEKKAPASSEPPADESSSDAKFSTYKENKDIPETTPPTGGHVIQELGIASVDKR